MSRLDTRGPRRSQWSGGPVSCSTVNAAGKVLEASVSRSTPDNAVLRDCMARALKAIAFPKPGGSYPIVLEFDLTVYPSKAGPGRKNRVAVKRR